ncbi:MAG: AAA family ATPase [Rhizobiales bacterium]|nr:AAA family ATPase [Hyphomicrobiales bacterium]
MFADARPHVILLGNQKGGSGKSTLAMHLTVGLLKSGQRVNTIDLDYDQRTLTRYVENRRGSSQANRYALPIPDHVCVDDLSHRGTKWNDSDRIEALSDLLRNSGRSCDFISDRLGRDQQPTQFVRARDCGHGHYPGQRQLPRSRRHFQYGSHAR